MARPRRKVGRGPKPRRFLVLVEGDVTEPDYLLWWRRRLRPGVQIDIPEFQGPPMALVKKAIEIRKHEEHEERRGRDQMHDEYWCVSDVDRHPELREAIELARSEGIQLVTSNPCIELWFLLHFSEQTAFIEARAAERAANEYTGRGKPISAEGLEKLGENFELAKERARRLEDKHRGDGTPAPGNPSSGVWRLIDALEAAGPAS